MPSSALQYWVKTLVPWKIEFILSSETSDDSWFSPEMETSSNFFIKVVISDDSGVEFVGITSWIILGELGGDCTTPDLKVEYFGGDLEVVWDLEGEWLLDWPFVFGLELHSIHSIHALLLLAKSLEAFKIATSTQGEDNLVQTLRKLLFHLGSGSD